MLAILVVSGVFAAFRLGKKTDPDYFTARVEKGDIRQVIEATGTINPVTSVQVGSQVSGMISKLYVDFNSKVKKGQVIAEIDPQLFQGAVLQSQADLQNAQALLAHTLKAVGAGTRLECPGPHQADTLPHQKLGAAEDHVLIFHRAWAGDDGERPWPDARLRQANEGVRLVHFAGGQLVRLRYADQLEHAGQHLQRPRIHRTDIPGDADRRARREREGICRLARSGEEEIRRREPRAEQRRCLGWFKLTVRQ